MQISGMPFKISYVGGTGVQSVVLTELDQSTTGLTFTPASPVFGQQVALTANVTGPAGSPTPTGTVQFFNERPRSERCPSAAMEWVLSTSARCP